MKCLLPVIFLCTITLSLFADRDQPRVSIITSVYDGDQWMKRFLENIVQQSIFDQCELLLINANSPGNEEEIIREYMSRYQNIRYIELEYDPGVYGVWNLGARMAHGDLLTNANLDDLRNPECLAMHVAYMDVHPEIFLIYSEFYLSYDAKGGWENSHIEYRIAQEEFSKYNIRRCLPGPQPMWRKSVHQKVGYFDETYLYSGDWEFWNRIARADVGVAKAPGISGIYYYNPDGLSTNTNPIKTARRNQEDARVIATYQKMWTANQPSQ
jgi:GT2 family glycosyltransferase